MILPGIFHVNGDISGSFHFGKLVVQYCESRFVGE